MGVSGHGQYCAWRSISRSTCFLEMLWLGVAGQSREPDWLVHKCQVYTPTGCNDLTDLPRVDTPKPPHTTASEGEDTSVPALPIQCV